MTFPSILEALGLAPAIQPTAAVNGMAPRPPDKNWQSVFGPDPDGTIPALLEDGSWVDLRTNKPIAPRSPATGRPVR